MSSDTKSSDATPGVDAPAIDADRALIAFMRERDRPCPACGRSLRNLASTACPACGTALVIGVQRADPFLLGWIITAIPATVALIRFRRWFMRRSRPVQFAMACAVVLLVIPVLVQLSKN